MFVIETLVSVLAASLFVEAVPVVFKEKTPNGEAVVAISSSDPNVEKYFTQQFSTRSGFTQLNSEEQDGLNNPGPRPQGAVQSSFSIAAPGKAIAGAGRSFASASSGPFLPIFSYPIAHESFGFNNFDLNDWVRNVESFYNPNFARNNHVNSVAAVNDNGHIYGHVNSLAFDNRAKAAENNAKNVAIHDNRSTQKTETLHASVKVKPNYDKKPKNIAYFDDETKYRTYY